MLRPLYQEAVFESPSHSQLVIVVIIR